MGNGKWLASNNDMEAKKRVHFGGIPAKYWNQHSMGERMFRNESTCEVTAQLEGHLKWLKVNRFHEKTCGGAASGLFLKWEVGQRAWMSTE